MTRRQVSTVAMAVFLLSFPVGWALHVLLSDQADDRQVALDASPSTSAPAVHRSAEAMAPTVQAPAGPPAPAVLAHATPPATEQLEQATASLEAAHRVFGAHPLAAVSAEQLVRLQEVIARWRDGRAQLLGQLELGAIDDEQLLEQLDVLDADAYASLGEVLGPDQVDQLTQQMRAWGPGDAMPALHKLAQQ